MVINVSNSTGQKETSQKKQDAKRARKYTAPEEEDRRQKPEGIEPPSGVDIKELKKKLKRKVAEKEGEDIADYIKLNRKAARERGGPPGVDLAKLKKMLKRKTLELEAPPGVDLTVLKSLQRKAVELDMKNLRIKLNRKAYEEGKCPPGCDIADLMKRLKRKPAEEDGEGEETPLKKKSKVVEENEEEPLEKKSKKPFNYVFFNKPSRVMLKV